MIARPLPLILFSPLAVWWMILHWRAVRRVETARSVAELRHLAVAAYRAREAFAAMTVALIRAGQQTMSQIRMQEGLLAEIDLSPLALYRPVSETLREAGIPSTFDPDRPITDVTSDRF